MNTAKSEEADGSGQEVLGAEALATYRGALTAFLARRLRDRGEVEDVVQEALTKLVLATRVRAIREPQAYLFQIARNLVADHLRRRAPDGLLEPLALWDEVPIQPEQENDRHRADLQRLFEAALDELPPRCREVFVLSWFDEQHSWSIALRLKITPRMVQKHLAKALAHLHARLGDYVEYRS
ncbi:sigma-70 family RNA polymerase sigma factor [Sphingomonas sp. CL5.1]|uniref:RNA polymerase sigma factor n=1 Tax=Sphingomonas sp. CL5.1 TaxID=2653203 RepID=UPI001581EFA8|nr:sigma-70 family RNA polymerase sigma factor [Sphingomonas sp. CL5.1]QKR98369.1 sigma-70 family RNA polymerase sigma factor [Sphingomonas sp. CL5.1]